MSISLVQETVTWFEVELIPTLQAGFVLTTVEDVQQIHALIHEEGIVVTIGRVKFLLEASGQAAG